MSENQKPEEPMIIKNDRPHSVSMPEGTNVAVGKKGEKRLDRISTICTRLYLHLKQPTYKPESTHTSNLVSFFLLDTIPNDLKMSLYMDVNKECSTEVKAMLKDKRLAKLLIGSL
jgi:hypothetical protein